MTRDNTEVIDKNFIDSTPEQFSMYSFKGTNNWFKYTANQAKRAFGKTQGTVFREMIDDYNKKHADTFKILDEIDRKQAPDTKLTKAQKSKKSN